MTRWLHRIFALAVLAVVLAACGATPNPPAAEWNDDFADRFVLIGASGSANGTNVGATIEPGEPFAVRSGTTWLASVWWTWTAPSSGLFAFDTVGTAFDTVLGVYTGDTLGALAVVGENDDAVGLQSRVVFEAVAGTAYQVAVGGWTSTASGAIVLNWGAAVE